MRKNIFSGMLLTAGAAWLLALTACSEREFYNDEQYRKECYLVSNDYNIFGQEYAFGENSVGYISVYMSGSTPVDHDVTVTLRPAAELLREYNQRTYGTSYADYAEILPENAYTTPEGWTVTITPDNPYTKFPVVVGIDRLNPTKTYFLPVEIASVSDYQYSAQKSYVLFRIFMKNDYATTQDVTYYQMYGTTINMTSDGTTWATAVDGDEPQVFNATKLMTPISEKAVRILPGATQSSSDDVISQQGLRLTVTDDIWQQPILGDDGLPTGKTIPVNVVTVEPMNEGSSCVLTTAAHDLTTGTELVSFFNPADGTFTLNYCYRLPTETANGQPLWHMVHEQMVRLN